jgi:hypothetical protein
MQYLLMAMEDGTAFEARADPERAGGYWRSWEAYIDALTEAGVLLGAGGLEPPATATTLRVAEGAEVVHDGPFADTKEQLGGYFVLEVPDLDAAMAWARRCPSLAGGSCEVRPLIPPRS